MLKKICKQSGVTTTVVNGGATISTTISDGTEVLAMVEGETLCGSDLRTTYLCFANLTNADMRGADLTGADLTGADLSGADLSHTILRNANLTLANLQHAKLVEADLDNARLTGARLQGANLSGCLLVTTHLSFVKSDEQTIWPDGYSAATKNVTGQARSLRRREHPKSVDDPPTKT